MSFKEDNEYTCCIVGPEFQEKDLSDKGYKWTESDESMEVSLYKHSTASHDDGVALQGVEGAVKASKLSAKDIKVEFKSRALKVSVKVQNGQLVPILNVALAGIVWRFLIRLLQ